MHLKLGIAQNRGRWAISTSIAVCESSEVDASMCGLTFDMKQGVKWQPDRRSRSRTWQGVAVRQKDLLLEVFTCEVRQSWDMGCRAGGSSRVQGQVQIARCAKVDAGSWSMLDGHGATLHFRDLARFHSDQSCANLG